MNTTTKNTLLLILRILIGGMIAYAGILKLMDMDKTISMLSGLNLSIPVIWAVSLGELLSGLGLIFGLYTQVAAIGAAIIMTGATYYTKGAVREPILLLAGSLILMYTGGGKYAIASYICPSSKN